LTFHTKASYAEKAKGLAFREGIPYGCFFSENTVTVKFIQFNYLPCIVYGKTRVFENRVLKRLFEPKRQEVAVSLRKLSNEELHNLYALLNIVRVMKSRRTRLAEHGACMEYKHKRFCWKT